MIIDTHCHVYPDKIAEKAAEGIGNFYNIPMRYNGTVAKLLETGTKAGIDKFLIHSVATTPGQVKRINDFVAETVASSNRFIGFGTMHQDLEDMEEEFFRIQTLGLRGIKLHPDIQKFQFNDPRMFKLYRLMEGKMPLLIHAGDARFNFSHPAQIADVVNRFPKLDIICAHFAGYTEWAEAEKVLAGRRIWVDTSSSLPFLSVDEARRLISAYGVNRVLFGTDYPMWDACDEMERFNKLGLSDEDRERILYKNAEELFAQGI